ncbi:hypothetical protein D3C73_935410 [compost metagenome]
MLCFLSDQLKIQNILTEWCVCTIRFVLGFANDGNRLQSFALQCLYRLNHLPIQIYAIGRLANRWLIPASAKSLDRLTLRQDALREFHNLLRGAVAFE